MEASTVALVLFAALLHAVWNALVKIEGDRLLVMALICAVSGTTAAVVLPFLPPPLPASWPYIAASLVWHLGYRLFLIQAYRHGDLGQVYPIARGTAPLLVAVVSLVFIGEALEAGQIVAVAVIAAGIISLAFRGGPPIHGDPRPVLSALGTSLFIAAYTVTDGLGARLAGSPHSYILWIFALDAVPMIAIALARRRRAAFALARARWRPAVAGGVLSLGSYWLVVWAFTLAPLAAVAALRETSVIFAAVIGAMFLKERFGRWRVAAATVVAIGIVLLKG